MSNTLILRKAIGFKKNINKHGLTLQYNIRADHMLDISYVAVVCMKCICSECLSKLVYP